MDMFGLGIIVCITVLGVLAIIGAIISCIEDNRKERLEKEQECYKHIAELIDGRFSKCERVLSNLCEVITLTLEEVRLMKKLSNKGKSKK